MPNRLGKVRQRGMALISALMVLVILGIIAGCFAIVMNRDSRQSRISSYQIICLNAAQAGIDYAVWLHKHNMAFYPAVDYSESIGGTANRLRINNASNKINAKKIAEEKAAKEKAEAEAKAKEEAEKKPTTEELLTELIDIVKKK